MIGVRVRHNVSQVLRIYADWRTGATEQEKHCYKNSPSVLLTFDDYGTKKQVEDILHILRIKGVKAMFFVTGDWVGKHADLVTRMHTEGHVVGNHTFSHVNLLSLSPEQVKQEIRRGITSKWLRPPQGRFNSKVREVAQGLGYAICYWTIDSRDWTGASVAAMRHSILSQLHPAAVILFHIHGRNTRTLLPLIIDDIRSKGYSLASHDEVW